MRDQNKRVFRAKIANRELLRTHQSRLPPGAQIQGASATYEPIAAHAGMLLKRIMLGATMFVKHEPGRREISSGPGFSHPRVAVSSRFDSRATRRAVRVAPHLHWLGRTRRAEPLNSQPSTDRQGPSRATRGAARRVQEWRSHRLAISRNCCLVDSRISPTEARYQ